MPVDAHLFEEARPIAPARTAQQPTRRLDAAAFRDLVLAHRPWMLAVARRYVRDAALAEDCVQDAFVSAFRHMERFEGRSSVKSWLHRIVVNAALMKLRSRRRHDDRAIEDLLPAFDGDGGRIEPSWPAPTPPNAATICNDRQVASIIRSKIAELPDTHRTILQLRDIEELSNSEVAARLQISEGAAKVRLHRARSALKRLLEPMLSDIL